MPELEREELVGAMLPRITALQARGSPQITPEDFLPRISKAQPFPRLQRLMEMKGGGS